MVSVLSFDFTHTSLWPSDVYLILFHHRKMKEIRQSIHLGCLRTIRSSGWCRRSGFAWRGWSTSSWCRRRASDRSCRPTSSSWSLWWCPELTPPPFHGLRFYSILLILLPSFKCQEGQKDTNWLKIVRKRSAWNLPLVYPEQKRNTSHTQRVYSRLLAWYGRRDKLMVAAVSWVGQHPR